MTRRYGLPGERYGRLTVVEEADPKIRSCGRRRRRVACKCDCGNEVVVLLQSLRNGDNVSCGCFSTDRKTKHGQYKSRTYGTWHSMTQRCLNSRHQAFASYGGRGISVCRRWMNSFEAFLQDMGEQPNGLQLDRINNDGNYEPENCRWVTRSEQQRNTRANRLISYNGTTKCLSEWAEHTGIHIATITGRLRTGWTIETALVTPPKKRR